MLKSLVLLALLVPLSTAAMAQNERGTDQEQKACARDVTRHCRSVIDQGDLVILACLKENRPKLTKACNQVLVRHGQ
jgi:hypothetical protein